MASPIAAWIAAGFVFLHSTPYAVLLFTLGACGSAIVGSVLPALTAILLSVAAQNFFLYIHAPGLWRWTNIFWSLVPLTLALIVAYERERRSRAETLSARLSGDLTRLREQLELQRADLRRFHDLSVHLSSDLELQHVLSDVLEAITTLLRTDLALILLLPDKTSSFLQVEASAGFDAEQIQLFGKFPVSFFSLERPVLIKDIGRPGCFFPFTQASARIGFRAMFSAPIVNAKGEGLGVMATFFPAPNAPSERQFRLVQLIAFQAANALDNVRRYRDSLETLAAEQQRTAVLRSLAAASVQIQSARSLDSLLQSITDQAREIIGTGQAFTTLLTRGAWQQSMTCFSAAEGYSVFDGPPMNSEFTLACTLNKPVRGRSRESHRPWSETNGEAQNDWLAAPLVTRDGRNLGLIHLSYKKEGGFSPDDEAILAQLAHMASVAIDNVRLYREAQEQIAETKRTQEALERSQESMHLAQQYVGIGVWQWDLQTAELVWSEEIRRLHGGALDTFESWMESVHPDDRKQVRDAISHALRFHGEYEIQYRVMWADRSIHWLEARGRAIVMGATPVRMLGLAIDITARRIAEDALRNSERLAATGRLAASIAHEINNPLAAVTNALYILRTRNDVTPDAMAYVKTAETELARVAHITRQTLGFYREIVVPAPTSLPDLLDEVFSAYATRIEKSNIAIHKQYRCPGQFVGFAGELRQVFSNLFLNALEAVPGGGTVSVRIKEAHNGRDQPGIQITVADNGPGIPPANLPRIFEPFFTTKDSKGTGLGLWVSQGIVEKHGGAIRVRSSTGMVHHGTCFVVFLPVGTAQDDGSYSDAPTDQFTAAEVMAKTGDGLTAA